METCPLHLTFMQVAPVDNSGNGGSKVIFESIKPYGSFLQQRYTLQVTVYIDHKKAFHYNTRSRDPVTLVSLKQCGHPFEVYRYRTGLFPVLYSSEEPKLMYSCAPIDNNAC